MLKTYEYRLYPTEKQKILFVKHFDCTRFIYNWALSLKIKAYEQDKIKLSCFDLTKELTSLKHKEDMNWLNEVACKSLQQSIRHVDNAFTNFFRKKQKFPKFKSKKFNHKSYTLPDQTKVDFKNHKIQILKFKEGIKFRVDRTFEGKIKTCTIKQTPTNKYFISILVDDGLEEPKKPKIKEKTSIGIDLGIKNFATFSTGEKIENQRNLKKLLPRLKVLQRRASRKQLGSNNRAKANLKVALLHEKIKNRRKDFLHKLTTGIINDSQIDTICLETLAVKDMMKNHKLAQSIGDASWGEFNRQLEYKSNWYGKNIIRIEQFQPSTKICNKCGYINNKLTLINREWVCPECFERHDRDKNAAINIKNFALQK